MSINYMAVEPDSQFYDDLSQLLQTMKNFKTRNPTLLRGGRTGNIKAQRIPQEEIDYIIKGLENTIERGYKINEPVPEGYQRIDVLEGSYVVPPQSVSTIASIVAHEVRKETGIGLMDAKALILEKGMNYLRVIEYITSGEREKDMRKRGIFVDNFYRSKLNQKENLTAIMRDDEKDGLYNSENLTAPEKYKEAKGVGKGKNTLVGSTFNYLDGTTEFIPFNPPKCGDCGKDMTLVRPGKYQCDHCGF